MILVALFAMLLGLAFCIWISWLVLASIGRLIVISRLLFKTLLRRCAELARDLPYRLRWSLLHSWNVVCLRWRCVMVTVAGFFLIAVVYCLVVPPIYSGTSVIRVERDQSDIS